jgi:4-hydroxybenzoate polyprenyltransferase
VRFGKNEKISYALFIVAIGLLIAMSIWSLPRPVAIAILPIAMLGIIFRLRAKMEDDDKGAEYKRQKNEEDAIAERLANQKQTHKIPSKKRKKSK